MRALASKVVHTPVSGAIAVVVVAAAILLSRGFISAVAGLIGPGLSPLKLNTKCEFKKT